MERGAAGAAGQGTPEPSTCRPWTQTGRFDHVLRFLMLHHAIEWPAALAETLRALRPGGSLRGYDLTDSRLSRAISCAAHCAAHCAVRSPHGRGVT
ncbi:MAG TPA: methyltransferase domain-containing protein [Nocardioides sp.]|nr:methyltransferase domain-containing protein [Nocardioides sp.]